MAERVSVICVVCSGVPTSDDNYLHKSVSLLPCLSLLPILLSHIYILLKNITANSVTVLEMG